MNMLCQKTGICGKLNIYNRSDKAKMVQVFGVSYPQAKNGGQRGLYDIAIGSHQKLTVDTNKFDADALVLSQPDATKHRVRKFSDSVTMTVTFDNKGKMSYITDNEKSKKMSLDLLGMNVPIPIPETRWADDEFKGWFTSYPHYKRLDKSFYKVETLT